MKKPLVTDLEDSIFLKDDVLVVTDRLRLPGEVVPPK